MRLRQDDGVGVGAGERQLPQCFFMPVDDTCFSVCRHASWPVELVAEWQSLLADSNADPLFMGWAWQSSWWDTWAEELGLRLSLISIREPGGRLVAIAPFYKTIRFTRVGLPLRTLQLVGNCWPFRDTVRTEYLDVIVRKGFDERVLPLLFDVLKADADWDELVLRDMEAGCHTHEWLRAHGRSLGFLSEVASDAGVLVPTSGSFPDYLKALGKNTRLKLFNRRKLLQECGGGVSFLPPEESAQALVRLNELHALRWGRPCFRGRSLGFHQRLLSRLGEGAESRFSVLTADGRDLSVLYDIKVGHRVYNLQCGFDDAFHPKLSLGTMHLGYALERYFEEAGIEGYDLLIGAGKRTFYKQHFQGVSTRFVSLRLLRSASLFWVFRSAEMGGRWRSWWPNLFRW